MSGRPDELLRLAVQDEHDVFQARRLGRQVAAAVDLDGQDQIRVATALSDLGRELVRQSVPAAVVFRLRRPPRPALVVDLTWSGRLTRTTGPGWEAARRLMDEVDLADGALTLVKLRPPGSPPLGAERVARLRRELSAVGEGSALDELRAQNQELLETLEDLEAKRAQLERVNAELEDTNRGVMALYKELSDELEQTNQGVVALYAELEEKSTQLREAAEARTRFWSNISHELRTPVNSVVGLARLLAASGADPLTEEQRRQVDLINESGSTLLALVNELLDTAKAESGSLRPRLAPVDLGYLVVHLLGALRPVVRTPGVELVVDELPELPPLVTDETMLTRILRNVLSNALKFTERGEVRLTARQEGDQLALVVADTGIGIPADQRDRVFEEFHQVPNPLQVGAGGTGLGLSYARRLAGILGGALTLRSEVGVGTEVVLRLPLGAPDLPTAVGTALIVDGDDDSRRALRALVGGIAEVVVEAADGRAGLDAARGGRPDLIFLDAGAPLMSGSEVLAVLRRDPRLAGVPVVVLCSDEPGGLERVVSDLSSVLVPRSGLTADAVGRVVREAVVAARRTVAR